jgi:hypothetical protein
MAASNGSTSSPRNTAAARKTAWIGFKYPVQRHKIPENASLIADSEGRELCASNSLAARIIAGVQKPHWIAPLSIKET